MVGFQYPAIFEQAEEGGYTVRFSDFDEIITQGDDLKDALDQAGDALEEAIANRIVMNLDIPEPSRPKHGQLLIPVNLSIAATAALYETIKSAKLSKVQLATTLGMDEREVRRLLDPYHLSKIPRIESALRSFGKRLVLSVTDEREIAKEAS
jgi:antitoxin HicB